MHREIETRIILLNVSKPPLDAFLKKFKPEQLKQNHVQRFKFIDIYDSSHFRIKRKVGNDVKVIEKMPVPVHTSLESKMLPVDEAVTLNCQEYSYFLHAFFYISPTKRIALSLPGNIFIRIWYQNMVIINVVIEYEFDDSFSTSQFLNYYEFVQECIKNFEPQDISIPFRKRTKMDVVKTLHHPRQLKPFSWFVVSPKWNGTRKNILFTECEIRLKPKGFEFNDIITNPDGLKLLKQNHVYIYYLVKNFGMEIESMPDGSNVLIDVCVGYNKLTRITIIRDSHVCDVLRSVLTLKIEPQKFYQIPIRDMLKVIGLQPYTDGFIIHTARKTYKIKPRKFQTIDLLMNKEYILVSAEGIPVGDTKKIDMNHLLKIKHVVYEVCIEDWCGFYEAFQVASRVEKSFILKKCALRCLRIRYDKGSRANSFANICNYLMSDLIHFMSCLR